MQPHTTTPQPPLHLTDIDTQAYPLTLFYLPPHTLLLTPSHSSTSHTHAHRYTAVRSVSPFAAGGVLSASQLTHLLPRAAPVPLGRRVIITYPPCNAKSSPADATAAIQCALDAAATHASVCSGFSLTFACCSSPDLNSPHLTSPPLHLTSPPLHFSLLKSVTCDHHCHQLTFLHSCLTSLQAPNVASPTSRHSSPWSSPWFT